MSAAVFYHQDQLQDYKQPPANDHETSSATDTLPSVARLMPLAATSSVTSLQSPHQNIQNNNSNNNNQNQQGAQALDFMYPVVSAANSYAGYQTLPEAPTSQSGTSYHLSINNTPTTPLNNYTAANAALATTTLSMLAPSAHHSSHGSIPTPGAPPMMGQHPLVGPGPGPGPGPLPYQQQQLQQPPVVVPQEKCTCKLNPNRIPRPRNAFILFRQKYHQLVLDESTEAKTNPEVSRELGRRWRALSPQEREHWLNLAEEEKKNHAKKYPNYRYTPRRHGKGKSCPLCQQKQLRQQQQQQQHQQQQHQQQHQQNQKMMRAQLLDQEALINSQKLPLTQAQAFAPQMAPFQQFSSLLQPLQQQQQQPQQPNPYLMGQFMFQSPFTQPQFGFPDQGQQQQQQQPLQHQPQGSPQQPLQIQNQQFVDMNQPHFMGGGYDTAGNHTQRFNSLPTAMGSTTSSYNGPEVYMQPQAPPK